MAPRRPGPALGPHKVSFPQGGGRPNWRCFPAGVSTPLWLGAGSLSRGPALLGIGLPGNRCAAGSPAPNTRISRRFISSP